MVAKAMYKAKVYVQSSFIKQLCGIDFMYRLRVLYTNMILCLLQTSMLVHMSIRKPTTSSAEPERYEAQAAKPHASACQDVKMPFACHRAMLGLSSGLICRLLRQCKVTW